MAHILTSFTDRRCHCLARDLSQQSPFNTREVFETHQAPKLHLSSSSQCSSLGCRTKSTETLTRGRQLRCGKMPLSSEELGPEMTGSMLLHKVNKVRGTCLPQMRGNVSRKKSY